MPFYVGRPNLPEKEVFFRFVDEIWKRKVLTNNGPLVQQFEREVADLVGVRNAVAVSNATTGLELVIRILGLTGEVILPSFTFIATAHALTLQGIKPVFCDIDKYTWCIDPTRVVELITKKTSAVLGVHLFGHLCDDEALTIIAETANLKLFYDAAHSFPSRSEELEVFSFHATKFINSFEGGVIVTEDNYLAEELRRFRNFGFAGTDQVSGLGTNAKMSEIHAAMGLASLRNLERVLDRNLRNYEVYSEQLSDIPNIFLRPAQGNLHYIVLEVEPTYRDSLVLYLQNRNVFVRRYFYPGCHNSGPYRTLKHQEMPNTDWANSSVICLPTGLAVTPDDALYICNLIKEKIQ